MPKRRIRIIHRPSGIVIAEGPVGWGITPFEGNFYIRRKYLRTHALASSWVPGLCPYKGLYVWLGLRIPGGKREAGLGWFYWLPNPLLPFIWFRAAVWGNHPELVVEEVRFAPSWEPISGDADWSGREGIRGCTCKEEKWT